LPQPNNTVTTCLLLVIPDLTGGVYNIDNYDFAWSDDESSDAVPDVVIQRNLLSMFNSMKQEKIEESVGK